MIIRSQDKKIVLNFANITDLIINTTNKDESEIIACLPYSIIDDCGYNKIGTYSTEEKAIKVLDMITEEYGKHLYGKGGQMATADIYIQPFAFIPPKVFQMPSDEEVEVQHEKEN